MTEEVPVSMDWRIGYTDESHSTCASWGLATWREQKGAIAWELLYDFNGQPRSKTLTPPFGDEAFVKYGWRPAPGTHWYGLSYSGRSPGAGKPVTCDDFPPKQMAFYSNIRIRITTECDLDLVGKLERRLKAARKNERRAHTQRRKLAGKVGKFRKNAKRSGGGLDILEREELRELNRQLQKAKRQEAVARKKRKNAYRKFREEREKCV
ncbi:MAG: hypothetical protein R2725_14615 [Solirubrobacterales bacterium]